MKGKLETGGCSCIDYYGLNKEDRLRIQQVGLNKWLDEICKAPKALPIKPPVKPALTAPAPIDKPGMIPEYRATEFPTVKRLFQVRKVTHDNK